jgi:hypothetical protein
MREEMENIKPYMGDEGEDQLICAKMALLGVSYN